MTNLKSETQQGLDCDAEEEATVCHQFTRLRMSAQVPTRDNCIKTLPVSLAMWCTAGRGGAPGVAGFGEEQLPHGSEQGKSNKTRSYYTNFYPLLGGYS